MDNLLNDFNEKIQKTIQLNVLNKNLLFVKSFKTLLPETQEYKFLHDFVDMVMGQIETATKEVENESNTAPLVG